MVASDWCLDAVCFQSPVTDHGALITNHDSRSMRCQPVVADAHLYRQGHVKRDGALYVFLHKEWSSGLFWLEAAR